MNNLGKDYAGLFDDLESFASEVQSISNSEWMSGSSTRGLLIPLGIIVDIARAGARSWVKTTEGLDFKSFKGGLVEALGEGHKVTVGTGTPKNIADLKISDCTPETIQSLREEVEGELRKLEQNGKRDKTEKTKRSNLKKCLGSIEGNFDANGNYLHGSLQEGARGHMGGNSLHIKRGVRGSRVYKSGGTLFGVVLEAGQLVIFPNENGSSIDLQEGGKIDAGCFGSIQLNEKWIKVLQTYHDAADKKELMKNKAKELLEAKEKDRAGRDVAIIGPGESYYAALKYVSEHGTFYGYISGEGAEDVPEVLKESYDKLQALDWSDNVFYRDRKEAWEFAVDVSFYAFMEKVDERIKVKKKTQSASKTEVEPTQEESNGDTDYINLDAYLKPERENKSVLALSSQRISDELEKDVFMYQKTAEKTV